MFAASESPIETVFVNSLVLSFIKADPLGLHVTGRHGDAPRMIRGVRDHHRRFARFLEWHHRKFGESRQIDSYLNDQVEKGLMDVSERIHLSEYVIRYDLGVFDRFHLTLQAGMPDIVIDGRSIRADLLFWVPSQDSPGIVVECDGFDYHSDRDAFARDRRRDRALKAAGYEVLRWSGSEIHRDPVAASTELFDYLSDRVAPSNKCSISAEDMEPEM